MSHLRVRKESNCLNCNAEIYGRYCHLCGQENLETKESTWHLVTHFFNDITHFDGKFFSTLKYMLFNPGFVSLEYMRGRRASYLNPIRMYVFTSAIFFLIFFSIYDFEKSSLNVDSKVNGKLMSDIKAMDSTTFATFTASINKGKPMSRDEFQQYTDSLKTRKGLHFTSSTYKSMKEYDSVLASGRDHNWLEQKLIRQEIMVNEKYDNDQRKILSAFIKNLVHTFPQMLFISLPLFALILKLLYIRRKQYYYTDHIIFSIHLYIFVFIILLIIMGLSKLKTATGFDWILYVNGLLYLLLFFYEYKSMRAFYKQGRWKTFFKFILLNFLHLFVIILLFTIFLFLSFLKT